MQNKQDFYEGYLSAIYGARDEKGVRLGYFEISKEMAYLQSSRVNGFWPQLVRDKLVISDMKRQGLLNGQQVREIALKHLAEIEAGEW